MEKDGEDRRKKRDKGPLARKGAVMSQNDDILQKLSEAEALVKTLTGMVETDGRGIVHLDGYGRIVAANETAERILENGSISTDVNRSMFVRSRQDNHEFQRVLSRALPLSGTQAVADSAVVSRPDSQLPLVIHVIPVIHSEKDPKSLSIAALVVIVDPLRGAGIHPTLIQRALSLTRAEANVAALLAQGKDVRAIAASTHRAENTIRTQVKHILAKLELTRQGALVHLVRSLGVVP